MQDAVAANYDYDKMTCPERQADGWYYWQFNDGTLARDVVVRSRDLDSHYGKGPSALGGPDLMFDPSAEEHTSLYWQSWSPSGRFTNLILQKSGLVEEDGQEHRLIRRRSDWQSIRTLDTHTMDPVNDDLTQSKFTFGGCWIGDSVRQNALLGQPLTTGVPVQEGDWHQRWDCRRAVWRLLSLSGDFADRRRSGVEWRKPQPVRQPPSRVLRRCQPWKRQTCVARL